MLYLLLTFLQSIPALFGIRSLAEEAPHRVIATLGHDVEVRAYAPGVAVETAGSGDGFSRLFAYIAGANARRETIAMTTPVEERGAASGRPASGGAPTMRFFLPAAAGGNPSEPTDAGVRLVRLPARTVATRRFSGRLGRERVAAEAAELQRVLAAAGRTAAGEPYLLGYDPPFTIPFLRRNEVAVDLAGETAG